MGAEVAQYLNLPLDLIITKKIRAPYNPELAIGSMNPTGNINMDQTIIAGLGISSAYLKTEAKTTATQIKNN